MNNKSKSTNAKNKSALKLVSLILLAVVLMAIAFFNSPYNPFSIYNINQGLDLKGGVSILYEADIDDPTPEEMDSAVQLMRSRLDSNNYTEAEVAEVGNNRISVDIPGVDDAEEAVNTIGSTAQLFFTDENMNVLLTGEDVADARSAVNSQTGGYEIELEFTAEGSKLFADATTNNVGKPIYIFLDNTILSAATVNEPITGGKAVITGNFTSDEARTTANLIKSGSLPFSLSTISVNNVGAKLGAEALNSSVYAGAIGIILVLLFMLFVYRYFGIFADVALVIYIGLILIFINLFNYTLTLPGIAGIILSVGMAVDANIIIFERIKEEMTSGKTLRYSVKSGFSRAFPAILDGNVTTLIASTVLMFLGTGTIKGFAQTLTLGIVLSMFTALIITRSLLNQMIGLGMGLKEHKFFTLKDKVFNIIDNRKKYFICSGLIMIIGISIVIMNVATGKQAFNYDVEFAGGVSILVDVGRDFDVSEIQDIVSDATGDSSPQIQKVLTDDDGEYDKYISSPEYEQALENQKAVEEAAAAQDIIDDTATEGTDEATDEATTDATDETVTEDTATELPTLSDEDIAILDGVPASPYRVSIKMKEITDEQRTALVDEICDTYDITSDNIQLNYISPTISQEMRSSAVIAMVVASILMLLYVTFRFKDYKMGASAIMALIHDAIIVILLYAVFRLPLNYYFIVAVLTILGYSINSTIVIFDRIRENKSLGKYDSKELINTSISQSITRSIFTSITTLLPLVCLLIFGVTSIQEFAIPIIVGIIVGTYSSVCLSASFWYVLSKKERVEKKKKIESKEKK